MICSACEKYNWDGIVSRESFLRRLKEAGIDTPNFNDRGFISIPR
jgi:hypothetical protein